MIKMIQEGDNLCGIVKKNTKPYVELCNPEFLQDSSLCDVKDTNNYTIIVSKLCKVAFHNVSSCLKELRQYTNLYWYCILNVSAKTITYCAAANSLPAYLKPHIVNISEHLHTELFTVSMKDKTQYVITEEFLNELNKYYDNPCLMWALVEVLKDCKLVGLIAKDDEPQEIFSEQEKIVSYSVSLYFYVVLSSIAVLMLYAMYELNDIE